MKKAANDFSKKHLVIGAGFCGLGVGAAFTRAKLDFDIVEGDDNVGGNWYRGVYETAHIISSRKTTQYSDYPMPKDWPDFPSAQQMFSYLNDYADHWKLRDRIEFNKKIKSVSPSNSGSWNIEFEDGEKRTYAGVVVCTGHHWDKRFPEYPGKLSIPVLHSKDYKNPEVLKGKRVLVIGGGNSACDIAVEAARFADSSHISLRRGYWFIPKTMFGIPTVELIKPWMPVPFQKRFFMMMAKVILGNYKKYGLPTPDHLPFEKHPTINSELLHFIRHGRILPHPDVKRYDGDTVEFVDGKREKFDLVVAATGYHMSFPIVDKKVVDWKGELPQLIGGVMSPKYKNIYFFGFGQPRYGAGPLITAGAEMLAEMVKTQAKIEAPLGAVLGKLGIPIPKTHLQDPHAVMRGVKMGKFIIPKLPKFVRKSANA